MLPPWLTPQIHQGIDIGPHSGSTRGLCRMATDVLILLSATYPGAQAAHSTVAKPCSPMARDVGWAAGRTAAVRNGAPQMEVMRVEIGSTAQ